MAAKLRFRCVKALKVARDRLLRLPLFIAMALVSAMAAAQDPPATNNAVDTDTPPPAEPGSQAPPQQITLQLPEGPLVIQSQGGGSPSWTPALITALGSLAASLIALFTALAAVRKGNEQSGENTRQSIAMTERNAQAVINQRSNELEIATIEDRLSNFFGPFMQLSEENKRLAGLLRNRQDDPDFRTLTALLDPRWREAASPTDLNLVKQIVANGVTLRSLIREKAGPVSPVLVPYLSQASAHFTILELAHDGQLSDVTDDFIAYVYPRQLDRVLELECDRLVTRRDALRADLSARHPTAPDLVLPSDLALHEGIAGTKGGDSSEASASPALLAPPHSQPKRRSKNS